MSSTNRRPSTFLEYLSEQDFMPQAEGVCFDHDTGNGRATAATQGGTSLADA